MTRCVFNADEVRKCVEARKSEGATFINFVKDEGIYFLGKGSMKPEERVIAYADGCDPRKGDVWDYCQAIAGGDDFAEQFPIDAMIEALKPGVKQVIVKLNKKTMSLIAR